MVSTRGIDARVEFLEHSYEGFITTHEALQELRRMFEEERLQRTEIRRQIGELIETVRGMSNSGGHAGGRNNSIPTLIPKTATSGGRNLKFQPLTVSMYMVGRVRWYDISN